MNTTKARKLRKRIYGDLSLKIIRRYVRDRKTGAVVNAADSLRGFYQRAKRGTL